MFQYEKKLQYPVKIKNPNPKYAQIIISQYGGPDGELGASLRYLSQRYSMPFDELKGLLTDIGTEELAHVEMVSAILYQLTKGLTPAEIKAGGVGVETAWVVIYNEDAPFKAIDKSELRLSRLTTRAELTSPVQLVLKTN